MTSIKCGLTYILPFWNNEPYTTWNQYLYAKRKKCGKWFDGLTDDRQTDSVQT